MRNHELGDHPQRENASFEKNRGRVRECHAPLSRDTRREGVWKHQFLIWLQNPTGGRGSFGVTRETVAMT